MFERVFSSGSPAFIPFLMAGYPSLEASERLANALIEEGAAALEIGVPFSDALADGPVIQQASETALRHGTRFADVLDLCARLRTRHPNVPLILFTYLNPLIRQGFDTYVRRARAAGASATLAVDLPPEEADDYIRAHREQGLQTVFLASPTTSTERLERIASASTAFLYYVSRTGVTGVQTALSNTLEDELARVRALCSCPIAVGFGISTGMQAASVARYADGVIVGSAFLKFYTQENDSAKAEQKARLLARECVQAIRAGNEVRATMKSRAGGQ